MKIVVTGGASGLGKAIVERLANIQGTQILISYSRSKSSADQLIKDYPNIEAVHCDFTDKTSLEKFCERIQEFNLTVLINNAFAGITSKHFHKMPAGVFVSSFEQSVLPTLKITQSMLRICRKKREGKIITILSSYLKNLPPIGMSEYVANKSYLFSMHKSWVSENAKFNISSYCLSPSFMLTPLNADVDERIVEGIREANPLKKLLTVEEVAEAVAFLTQGSGHLNGSNLFMNSGDNI